MAIGSCLGRYRQRMARNTGSPWMILGIATILRGTIQEGSQSSITSLSDETESPLKPRGNDLCSGAPSEIDPQATRLADMQCPSRSPSHLIRLWSSRLLDDERRFGALLRFLRRQYSDHTDAGGSAQLTIFCNRHSIHIFLFQRHFETSGRGTGRPHGLRRLLHRCARYRH